MAQGPTRKQLPSVQTPAGVVSIVGRATIPPKRYLELKADTGEGTLRQNLDIERIAAVFRVDPAAVCRRTDRPGGSSRRAAARLAVARLRHRAPPFIYGAVVLARSAGGRSLARAQLATSLGRRLTPPLKRRGRRPLLILALLCAAPVVASYVAYYWFRPVGQVNYGELLEARPAREIVGTLSDGGKFRLSDYRGRWLFLAADAGELRRRMSAQALRDPAGAHDPGARTGARGARLAAGDPGALARAAASGAAPGAESSHGSIRQSGKDCRAPPVRRGTSI